MDTRHQDDSKVLGVIHIHVLHMTQQHFPGLANHPHQGGPVGLRMHSMKFAQALHDHLVFGPMRPQVRVAASLHDGFFRFEVFHHEALQLLDARREISWSGIHLKGLAEAQ